MNRLWILTLCGLGAGALAGCFSPAKPKCQFRCGTAPNQCPSDYECRGDGYCHRASSPASETCDFPITPDAAVTDAALPDAAIADAALPDAAVPDAAIPDAAIPDASTVDAAPPIDAPECTMSSQCSADPNRPICTGFMCSMCMSAAECTSKNSAFKACLPAGSCAECDDDMDCGASAPRCNTATNTCTTCSSDANCSFRATTPVCADDGSGGCVAATPADFAGCTVYTDRSAGSRDITFDNGNFTFAPKCMRINAGQTVTWMGDFTMHPLRGAPGNPGTTVIPNTDTGTSQPVTFSLPGVYGFHCNIHGQPSGMDMAGAIQVQ